MWMVLPAGASIACACRQSETTENSEFEFIAKMLGSIFLEFPSFTCTKVVPLAKCSSMDYAYLAVLCTYAPPVSVHGL